MKTILSTIALTAIALAGLGQPTPGPNLRTTNGTAYGLTALGSTRIGTGSESTNQTFRGQPKFGLDSIPDIDTSSDVWFLESQADGRFQRTRNGNLLTNLNASKLTDNITAPAVTRTFTNIAEMKVSPFTNGVVYVRSYWGTQSVGGEWIGGGYFRHESTDIVSTNRGTIFSSVSNGRWNRLHDKHEYDITWFGAMPVKSSGDFNNASNYIKAAIDTAPDGSTILFPHYDFASGPITITNRIGITLKGYPETYKLGNFFGGPKLYYVGPTNNGNINIINSESCAVDGLLIYAHNPITSTSSNVADWGINIDQVEPKQIICTDIEVRNCSVSLQVTNREFKAIAIARTALENCEEMRIKNCRLSSMVCGDGVYVGPSQNALNIVCEYVNTTWFSNAYHSLSCLSSYHGLDTGSENVINFSGGWAIQPSTFFDIRAEQNPHYKHFAVLGAATDGLQITIENCSIANLGSWNYANPVFDIVGSIALRLIHNQFAAAETNLQIFAVHFGKTPTLYAEGNQFPHDNLDMYGLAFGDNTTNNWAGAELVNNGGTSTRGQRLVIPNWYSAGNFHETAIQESMDFTYRTNVSLIGWNQSSELELLPRALYGNVVSGRPVVGQLGFNGSLWTGNNATNLTLRGTVNSGGQNVTFGSGANLIMNEAWIAIAGSAGGLVVGNDVIIGTNGSGNLHMSNSASIYMDSGNILLTNGNITLQNGNFTNVDGFISGNGSGLFAMNASAFSSGTMPPARLGSGSGGATKFLREDSTWQTVSGGGGGGGSATNAISEISSNNVSIATSVTNLDFWMTGGLTSRFTNRNGHVDVVLGIGDLSGTYQPLDSDLTSIAALSTTSGGRALLTLADPGANTIVGWDDTDNSFGNWTIGSGLSYTHATHTLAVGDLSGTYQPLDADLTDLADGSLSGSKVGSGIVADNITSGTVAPARLGSGSGGSTKFLREDSTWQTLTGNGDVTAAATFSLDNSLIRADGTSKGVENTTVTFTSSSGTHKFQLGATNDWLQFIEGTSTKYFDNNNNNILEAASASGTTLFAPDGGSQFSLLNGGTYTFTGTGPFAVVAANNTFTSGNKFSGSFTNSGRIIRTVVNQVQTLDWTLPAHSLETNASFTFAASGSMFKDSQYLVAVTNSAATNILVTWPSNVFWLSTNAIAAVTEVPASSYAEYDLRFDGTNIIGRDFGKNNTNLVALAAVNSARLVTLAGDNGVNLTNINGENLYWPTNAASTTTFAVNPGGKYSGVSTNNNLSIAGVTGIDSGSTKVSWGTAVYTNNSVGAKTISIPAAWIDVGNYGSTTIYNTNQGILSVWVYPGFGTNFIWRGK